MRITSDTKNYKWIWRFYWLLFAVWLWLLFGMIIIIDHMMPAVKGESAFTAFIDSFYPYRVVLAVQSLSLVWVFFALLWYAANRTCVKINILERFAFWIQAVPIITFSIFIIIYA